MEFHPNDLSDLDDLTEEHLGFSALSAGLGFSRGKERLPHPATQKAPVKASELPSIDADFDEDPLPARKSAPYQGTGATLAGPVRFAAQAATKAPAKAAATNTNSILGPTPAAAAQVLAEPAAPRSLRLAAFTLDALFLIVPLSLGWLASFGSAAKEIFLQDPASPLSLFAVIFGAYFLLSESFGGQSLGKMLLRLRVVEDDKYQKPTGFGHAAARLGLFLFSTVCFGIGLVASFWDAKRRPWHDRYSGSIVRRSA
jgi:uncharacterized RDD family membrane protein YckC